MKQRYDSEASPSGKSTTDVAPKKAYQRPVVRVLGAVHLMTRGTGATANGDGGQMMMVVTSDRAVKQNLARIGDHPLGIGIYLFDYKPEYREKHGFGRRFGVIADEVETIMPDAVSVHPDGYKMVDYGRLGITKAIR